VLRPIFIKLMGMLEGSYAPSTKWSDSKCAAIVQELQCSHPGARSHSLLALASPAYGVALFWVESKWSIQKISFSYVMVQY
jgi:hypothetical protein